MDFVVKHVISSDRWYLMIGCNTPVRWKWLWNSLSNRHLIQVIVVIWKLSTENNDDTKSPDNLQRAKHNNLHIDGLRHPLRIYVWNRWKHVRQANLVFDLFKLFLYYQRRRHTGASYSFLDVMGRGGSVAVVIVMVREEGGGGRLAPDVKWLKGRGVVFFAPHARFLVCFVGWFKEANLLVHLYFTGGGVYFETAALC